VRKLSTTLTFLVVSVVVFVLAVLLSFAAGIRATLTAGGRDDNILVLARGATTETTSIIRMAEAGRVVQTPGLARDSDGTLLMSQEICVQTSIPRLGPDQNLANVAVRGVDDVAFRVHSSVRMLEGRKFEQGALEAIVGTAAQLRYANLALGDEIALGRLTNRQFHIVGVFEAGGGALENEVWAPRGIIADVYSRGFLSSVMLRVGEGRSVAEAMDYINGPAVGLEAKTETEYYREVASKTREIVVLAIGLISIMSMGAIFAVANTMYAAVDGRRREIAMLRTIGFARRSILVSFTLESLLICLPACVAGLAASAFLSGTRTDYLSDATWTVLPFELIITPYIVVVCLGTATAVGIAGAFAPALKATRMRVVDALRKV